MIKVLIADPLDPVAIEKLQDQKIFQVDVEPDINAETLLNSIGNYEVVLVRSRTKITSAVIKRAQKLKVIGRAGSGLDNIDLYEAKKRKIKVLNTPEGNSDSVAELVIGLIFALARHIPQANQSLRDGKWQKKLFKGCEIDGKILGLIGYGRIGQRVAKKALALGLKVIAYDAYEKKSEIEGVIMVDLEKVLRASDFVSIHVPLFSETKNMIDSKEFKMMKRGAYLINAARGGIVNEKILIKYLKDGYLGGAAIDAFIDEPKFNKELVSLPNVVSTPHLGASTYEAQQRCSEQLVDRVLDHFADFKTQKALSNLPYLTILSVEKIVPHEESDIKRCFPLVKKIREDKVLIHPIMVAKAKHGKFVLLDGANRFNALKKIGAPHILVQIVNYRDHSTQLLHWNHLIRPPERLKNSILNKFKKLSGIEIIRCSFKEARFGIKRGKFAAYIQIDANKQVFAVKNPKTLKERLKLLCEIVGIYHGRTKIYRLDSAKVDEEYKTKSKNSLLFIFPDFTKKEIIQAVEQEIIFPGGITRHVISDRVLGVHLYLELLESKKLTLEEKNQKLEALITRRIRSGDMRHYAESTYVFDYS